MVAVHGKKATVWKPGVPEKKATKEAKRGGQRSARLE
jgi:hypothetical protein